MIPDPIKLNLETLVSDVETLLKSVAGQSLRQIAEYARAGQQLENLVRHRAGKVWVEADRDEIAVMIQDLDGRFYSERGLNLPDALQGVKACQDGKICKGQCGSWKPLDAFNRNSDNPDGRCYRCRACEKFRLRKRRRRKRAG